MITENKCRAKAKCSYTEFGIKKGDWVVGYYAVRYAEHSVLKRATHVILNCHLSEWHYSWKEVVVVGSSVELYNKPAEKQAVEPGYTKERQ